MKPQSSPYIESERKQYSLYVLQSRAIVAATDGLKSAGRRALWTAKNGHKFKTATLAGATMPIHPHAECSGAINTLAAPYGNNIPLFKGDGAFGTLLNPTAYGAARYTSVTVSKFTDDVIFRDIEIVPLIENYDGSLMEPIHFLPLVPVALLNPSEGIAVGFASTILPRSLDDLIDVQLAHLRAKKKLPAIQPHFVPTDSKPIEALSSPDNSVYVFEGAYTIKDASTIVITQLPYGMLHSKIEAKIDALYESGEIQDYEIRSKNTVHIIVKTKRGWAKSATHEEIVKRFGLREKHTENLNVLDFTGKAVWHANPTDLITRFTDWRLSWYVDRYTRLKNLLELDLSKMYDIRTAIKNKVGAKAPTIASRQDLKTVLADIGIVNLDYIADLGVYRYTKEENERNEQRIVEATKQLKEYEDIIGSRDRQVDIYSSELKEVQTKYRNGAYTK